MSEAVRAERQQVRRDPVELRHDDADVLRPRRDLDREQLLDRQAERQVVAHRREVVHPVRVRDELLVPEVLADLLGAAVEVAHDGRHLAHHLAVGADHEAQHAVGGGVLRPHVEEHVLGFDGLGAGRHALSFLVS
jgi:hypothetical protein